MKRFLIWISFLFVFTRTSAQNVNPDFSFAFNEKGKAEYALFIQFKDNGITGVCILKQCQGYLAGSIINEFGIKAFDFTYKIKTQRVSLYNLAGFIDKWYIRKAIKSDWQYLFAYPDIKRKTDKREITAEAGKIVLKNHKNQITYTLTPIPQTESSNHEAIE